MRLAVSLGLRTEGESCVGGEAVEQEEEEAAEDMACSG